MSMPPLAAVFSRILRLITHTEGLRVGLALVLRRTGGRNRWCRRGARVACRAPDMAAILALVTCLVLAFSFILEKQQERKKKTAAAGRATNGRMAQGRIASEMPQFASDMPQGAWRRCAHVATLVALPAHSSTALAKTPRADSGSFGKLLDCAQPSSDAPCGSWAFRRSPHHQHHHACRLHQIPTAPRRHVEWQENSGRLAAPPGAECLGAGLVWANKAMLACPAEVGLVQQSQC